jgi:hypothetical protein
LADPWGILGGILGGFGEGLRVEVKKVLRFKF